MGKYRYIGGSERAKRRAYRQSDAGRLARKMYLMMPEVKMRMSLRRKIKRQLKEQG